MGDAERPNILLIITDQQRCDALGCYGSDFVSTPAADKLAKDGIVFNRAYCTNPVCTPSRVSIFTGMHTSSHGAWNIGTVAEDSGTFISSILRQKGYSTWYTGKMHFSSWATSYENSREGFYGEWENNFIDFKTPYYGFEHVELSMGHTSFGHYGHYGLWLKEKLNGRKPEELMKSPRSSLCYGAESYDWEMPVELHNSTWVAERTINALRHAKTEGKPFFMTAGFQDPHHPHCLPMELSKHLEPSKMPVPSFVEGELDDKPPHFKLAHEGKKEYPTKAPFRTVRDFPDAFCDVGQEEAQLNRAYYYAMGELVDRSMGRILDELENLGIAENTIVIFTTDHGELLGDHGLWRKGPFHYEQLVKVPLIIRWPSVIKKTTTVDGIVSLADLAPTILAAVGEQIPEGMDGISMLPVFENENDSIRDHAFVEYVDRPDELRLKTVVTDRYKLTIYHQKEYGELYDLEHDPMEIVNLFSAPEMKDIKTMLMLKIMDEMERTERKLRLKRIGSS